MQTANAIKKLEKAGFTIESGRAFIVAKRGNAKITFIDQDGEVVALGDGSMRYDNLSQALALS